MTVTQGIAANQRIRLPRAVAWAACLAGIVLVLFPALWFSKAHIVSGADDFLALYGGARLAGTSHLYDPAAIKQTQIQATGMTGPVMLYIRLPWLALLLWPLAQMPYVPAHAIWLAIRFVAVAGFILLWPHSKPSLTAVVCCWSMPLALGLTNGQDAPLLLLWLALSERFQKFEKPFLAGAILSLCTAKFHLFLLLPLLYLIHRKWPVLAGMSAGCAVLAALSWVAGGWGWPAAYLRVLLVPDINPARWFMPNLHGFFPSGAPEWVAMVIVASGAILMISRLDYLTGLAVALTGGLLLSYHAYFQDALLLIPAILIALKHANAILRYAGAALATPLPWVLMLLLQRP
jgi:Glycosyltransferase family 87